MLQGTLEKTIICLFINNTGMNYSPLAHPQAKMKKLDLTQFNAGHTASYFNQTTYNVLAK